MHWLMACSAVMFNQKKVTVSSLHTCQVIQTLLFQKCLCKLVTDVIVIA